MTTCVPSMADLGAEQLTLWPGESPAKGSAEPAKGLASSTPATSGLTLSASSKKRAPHGSSSKTWPTSVRSTIGVSFSKTLRRQGMMLDGVCSALETWALPTFASASGCSPQTPEPSAWPTPTSTLASNGGQVTPTKAREGGTLIEALSARTQWPTPRCADGIVHPLRSPENIQAGMDRQNRQAPCRLEDAVSMNRWPTPTATDAVRCPSRDATTPNVTLNHAALWATRDHKSGKASAATHNRNSRPLSEQVGNLLNPTWVEWLMGWPINWTDPSGGPSSEDFHAWLESNRTALTDYVRLATVRYHSAAPLRGSCLVARE